jgi:hypothetical protein
MSYTKGPWKVGKDIAAAGQIMSLEGLRIARTTHARPERDANTRLMSAAPELLEALIDCVDALEDGHWQETKRRALAAIAKATGDTQ